MSSSEEDKLSSSFINELEYVSSKWNNYLESLESSADSNYGNLANTKWNSRGSKTCRIKLRAYDYYIIWINYIHLYKIENKLADWLLAQSFNFHYCAF